ERGDAPAHPVARPRPSRHRVPERASPRRVPRTPLRMDRPAPSDPYRPLGRGLLESARAADPGGGGVLLPRHVHHDRVRRCRPRAWLADAGGDRGPHGSPAGRVVDGVRVRGRAPHVRALAAGARRVLTIAHVSPRPHRACPPWARGIVDTPERRCPRRYIVVHLSVCSSSGIGGRRRRTSRSTACPSMKPPRPSRTRLVPIIPLCCTTTASS